MFLKLCSHLLHPFYNLLLSLDFFFSIKKLNCAIVIFIFPDKLASGIVYRAQRYTINSTKPTTTEILQRTLIPINFNKNLNPTLETQPN